jgi:hypothetical protein
MKLRKRIAFAKKGLAVAYRASAESQVLEIRTKCGEKRGDSIAPMIFREMLNCTSKGIGGGAEFDPSAVRFKHLKGPVADDDAGAAGPEWRWKVEVASLSPRYMRNIVEQLSLCPGGDVLLETLSIQGTLKLDDTTMSVRESDVVGWLGDPLAWPGAWSSPGFKIKDVVSNGGVTIRLKMKGPVTPELTASISGELLDAWGSEIAVYVGRDGAGGRMGIRPKSTANKTTLVMHYDYFTFEPKPTRDMLVNVLAWFHANVSPIAEAELAFEA